MRHLDLEDAQAGMVLGQDVLGGKGQRLLSAGTTLTGEHLELLRARNVRRIVVRPIEPAAPAPAVDRAKVNARIEAKFRLCNEQHPLIHELRRLCHNRLTRE